MVVNPKHYYNCPISEQTHITTVHIWTGLLIANEQHVVQRPWNKGPSQYFSKQE